MAPKHPTIIKIIFNIISSVVFISKKWQEREKAISERCKHIRYFFAVVSLFWKYDELIQDLNRSKNINLEFIIEEINMIEYKY